jgi:hypothetical protein
MGRPIQYGDSMHTYYRNKQKEYRKKKAEIEAKKDG